MATKKCRSGHVEIEFEGRDPITFSELLCPLCEAERIIERLQRRLNEAQQESRPYIIHEMGQ